MQQSLDPKLQSIIAEGVRERPASALHENEWHVILSHLLEHEKNGTRPEGSLLESVDEGTTQHVLYTAAEDYLQEHNGGALLPESEQNLAARVKEFVEQVQTRFERVGFDATANTYLIDLMDKYVDPMYAAAGTLEEFSEHSIIGSVEIGTKVPESTEAFKPTHPLAAPAYAIVFQEAERRGWIDEERKAIWPVTTHFYFDKKGDSYKFCFCIELKEDNSLDM